ncbi:hypothetical protein FisN_20Lh256 [Fistulifera solaris]|uniref:Digalactosyldiacylglycerol synthase n=1 Tax=Fistulifera solaris TaxID=1519565 RepID=A0A1Z5KRK1_FISSO|nr:hypothetical protein FisN_20Lh256 [Fistulifera solaris]|eukprot:GAX28936.1 hypothetical protein FisN_20Lh256 [Fistulifera solaris]
MGNLSICSVSESNEAESELEDSSSNSLSFSSSSGSATLTAASPIDADEVDSFKTFSFCLKQEKGMNLHPLCPRPFFFLTKRQPAFEVATKEDECEQDYDCRGMTRASICSSLPIMITTRTPNNRLSITSDDHNSYAEKNTDETFSPLAKISSWLSFSSFSTEAGHWSKASFSDEFTDEELLMSETIPTTTSNLRDSSRPIWIVTTAALPWFTGTAVNPLLRAAYLLKYRQEEERVGSVLHAGPVHLVIPWLESPDDRVALYGEDWRHATPETQTDFIRDWIETSAHLPSIAHELNIHYYPARYHAALSSIFAMGDIFELIESKIENCDSSSQKKRVVCILEEPEHLNYFRAPSSSCSYDSFYTIGIVHTNYKYYAEQHVTGLFSAPIVEAVSAGLVCAYCDQVIKLSDVLQEYAKHKEVVCNVHGIRNEFLDCAPPDGNRIYFLGKLLWAKGLDQLLYLQECYKHSKGEYLPMDIFGSGPEKDEIETAYRGTRNALLGSLSASSGSISTMTDNSEFRTSGAPKASDNNETKDSAKRPTYWAFLQRRRLLGCPLPVQFLGRTDHASIGTEYKIFVNPSISEVLCTTTAEALAMGKFVVLPEHPSNDFFKSFPNALFYSNASEFVQQVSKARSTDPEPLSQNLSHLLSWEAATERLFESAAVSEREASRRERLYEKEDRKLAMIHYKLGKGRSGDVIRKFLGGGPVANQVQYQMQRHVSVTPTA